MNSCPSPSRSAGGGRPAAERYRRANERGSVRCRKPPSTLRRRPSRPHHCPRSGHRSLEKRRVRRPCGYVGFSDLDPGDRVDVSTAVTTLDDRATLLINFEVPEAYLGAVAVGDGFRWKADRPAPDRGRHHCRFRLESTPHPGLSRPGRGSQPERCATAGHELPRFPESHRRPLACDSRAALQWAPMDRSSGAYRRQG